MTCDLFTVFHSAGPTTLTVSLNLSQMPSNVRVLTIAVLESLSLTIWGIDILQGNSLIHSVSFSENVK